MVLEIKILMVDDDAEDREIMEEGLKVLALAAPRIIAPMERKPSFF
jgi:hypothetical protein